MVGYILYGELSERGCRKYLNVLIEKTKNGVTIEKRKDQKKFYRNQRFFENETILFSNNPQKLSELLEGKKVCL